MEVTEHYTKAQRRAFMRMWIAACVKAGRDGYRAGLATTIHTFKGE